jgi:hypothetical protein
MILNYGTKVIYTGAGLDQPVKTLMGRTGTVVNRFYDYQNDRISVRVRFPHRTSAAVVPETALIIVPPHREW